MPVLLNPSRFGGGGGGGGVTTWDFRGLGSLPAGWARRGVASETFDAAGMSATYGSGQNHYYALGSTFATGVVEAKMVSTTNFAAMSGPIIELTGVQGACVAWYTVPSGALLLGTNSSYTYDGNFSNAGGGPTFPAWFRVRLAAGVAYGSYSLDGVTYSSEVTITRASMTGINEISVGSIIATATVKWEYVKWTTP